MAQNNTSNSLDSRCLSHGLEAETQEWSFAEHKSFERALATAMNDMENPLYWTHMKAMTPMTTETELMKHYIELREDLDQIEAGVYDDEISKQFYAHECAYYPSPTISHQIINNGNTVDDGIRQKKKVAHWTQDEHKNFLKGLKEHGRNWIIIAENYVKTRNHIQVASHAQKYFKKQEQNASNSGEGNKSNRKKRNSIHDITMETIM